MSDYYHDDPVEESRPKSKKLPGLFALLLFIFAGGNFLQTTLAANISLGSGGQVEFGQASSIVTACSEGYPLTVTPKSEFVNSAGAGAHYVKSVQVSGIPASCNGKDFNISFFDANNSNALPLFETTTSIATVWNNGGTFVEGYQGTGTTITSGSGTFTVAFNSPVALSADAQKITLQSTEHKSWTCADGKRPCVVGETGPGGGIVFYVNAATFNCGPTWSATCKYLEVAPSGWNGGTDPTSRWISEAYRYSNINSAEGTTSDTGHLSYQSIGRGYRNSLAITSRDNSTSAASVARKYTGGGLNDWYLPNFSEMNTFCHWNTGTTPASGIRCENIGGSDALLNKSRFGAQLAGIVRAQYWTSTEKNDFNADNYDFNDAANYGDSKNTQKRIRPIRAFN